MSGITLQLGLDIAVSSRMIVKARQLLKRRQAIEPISGHLKQDHRMDRCHLKGEVCWGDHRENPKTVR